MKRKILHNEFATKTFVVLACLVASQANAAQVSFQNVAGGVSSTGLNTAGVALAGGSVDPHYVIAQIPTGCAGTLACSEDGTLGNSFGPSSYVVLGPNGTFPLVPTAWASTNDLNSGWIGPRANQTNPITGGTTFPNVEIFGAPGSPYVYRMVFNLTALGLNPLTANIQLGWISDGNSGAQIRLCSIASAADPVCAAGTTITPSSNTGPTDPLFSSVSIQHGFGNANFTAGLMALDFIVPHTPLAPGQLNPSGVRVQIFFASAATPGSASAPAIVQTIAPTTLPLGGVATITFQIHNPNDQPMTNASFADALSAGLVVDTPNGSTVTGCGIGSVSAVAGSSSIAFGNGQIPANGDCFVTVNVRAIATGVQTSIGGAVSGNVDTVPFVGNVHSSFVTVLAPPPPSSFLVRYAANLQVGEAWVNFTNTGAASTAAGIPGAQDGNLCANIYAYSPDEQMISCCTCLVTPNGLASLSVQANLTINTLTPIVPTSVVMKVISTLAPASQSCNAATVTRAATASGLLAWGTSQHALPTTPGTPAGTYGITETPFSVATLSDAELTRMTQLCSFIRANGSGFGICKSCKVGGLGGSSK